MGSVENLPSCSVWGCSAPPAAIWKNLSTVCTGCFSKDLMVLFKTKQNKKKKRRGSEDLLEYVPAIWIMMEDITGELESPLASMAHGHAFISLQGMDFFIYTFFFFLSNKAFSKDQLQKKIPGLFGRIPCYLHSQDFLCSSSCVWPTLPTHPGPNEDL